MTNEWPEASQEKKEQPSYSLTLSVNRHGPRPKSDTEGLSALDRAVVFEKTYDNYEGVLIDPKIERRSIVSPKIRTKNTDSERQRALAQQGAPLVPVSMDERLSEGGMDHILSLIAQGRTDWFRDYYFGKNLPPQSGDGTAVVKGFASLMLDTIKEAQQKGGEQDVDVTTHAPLMAAFIFRLEDKLRTGIVSNGAGDERRFDQHYLDKIAFPLMSSFNIFVSSDKPDSLVLFINGKHVTVALSVIEDFASGNFQD